MTVKTFLIFILLFRHQLRIKIRCDRKRLDYIKFDRRWVYAASLVVRKGTMLKSPVPPLPTSWEDMGVLAFPKGI